MPDTGSRVDAEQGLQGRVTTTLIRDTTVITVDGARKVYSPGAVVVTGTKITDIGPSDEVQARNQSADHIVDGRAKVVLPGFVSVHNHLGYTVFRGRGEDLGYTSGDRLHTPMLAILSREERCDIGCLAAAELLRGGTTTILEMEEDGDVFAPYIERIGMRAVMSVMVYDIDIERRVAGEIIFSEGVRETQLAQAMDFAERWNGKAQGRINTMMTANSLISSSPAQLRALRDAADRLGVRLSIHLGTGEAQTLKRLYDAGPIEFARDNGFLASDVIAVHCYRLTEPEVVDFAASGAHLAHCPQINSFRGMIAPVKDLRSRGVTVGLGVDNYFSDPFDVMRACITVARIRENDPKIVPAAEALELATIEAARVLGLDEHIGSLEVGKNADLQIVNMRSLGLTPVTDPVRTLVYHGHAKDVETVMVDGRILVEDGAVCGEDEVALLDAAAQAADRAWQRFAERYGDYVAPG